MISTWKKTISIVMAIGFAFTTASSYRVSVYANEPDQLESIDPLGEQEYYFDFFPSTYELRKGKEIEVNIEHKISDFDQSRWKVKPVAEGAIVTVYNPETQRWAFSNNSWLEMPNLKEKIYIKGASAQERVPLKLLIKDLKENKIYETPIKELFTTKAYNSYLEKINENVKTWRQTRQSSQSVDQKAETVTQENQTKTLKDLRNTNNLLGVLLGASFLAGIVGFIKKSDKIPT